MSKMGYLRVHHLQCDRGLLIDVRRVRAKPNE